MPANVVKAARDWFDLNWSSLPPSAQYAVSAALSAASVVLYDALMSPKSDWHQIVTNMVHAAAVALICHRLPKPSGDQK